MGGRIPGTMGLFGKKETVTLRIQGMTCANCQKHVGEALRSVPGVASANVDLAFHRASVTYDPEKATLADMEAAVEQAGYRAEPLEARR